MQVLHKACFYLVLVTILNSFNSVFATPFMIKTNSSSFEQDIERMRQTFQDLHFKQIEFPVQKSKKDHATFIRKGILIMRPDALGTVVVCHGFTQSKYEAAFFRTLFPHFNVLAFDFRAHGDLTDGQYSTIGNDELYDIKGAVDFVKSIAELESKPIIGFGFSMGAVTLLQAQAEYPDLFTAMIMDSPFDSSSDCMAACIDRMLTVKFFGQKYRIPGKKVMMKCLYCNRLQPVMRQVFRYAAGFNNAVAKTKFVPVLPIENAPKITVPCYFITCQNDQKVPVGCVRRLYDAVPSSYKRLWITKGIRHCGSCLDSPELYAYRINKFIKNVLYNSWTQAEKIHDDRGEVMVYEK
ncbi:alpha/beta fold hydrolase [Candidatus Dependentiae bacterium]|nr:alpha/beta fold hydrolase [Candidatus Dependentiae bacterium]